MSAEQQILPVAGVHEWEFHARRDLPHFRDHFPGMPILPGVALLDLAVIPELLNWYADLGVVCGLARVKFRRPIMPDAVVHMAAERLPGQLRIRFRACIGDDECASGIVEFEPA